MAMPMCVGWVWRTTSSLPCARKISGIAKPDARLFHEALQRGGATAETAVHIGDHPGDDIAGAQQAGLRAIWFNPAGKVWEADRLPDAEIRSLTDLPAVLARWNAVSS